MTENNAIEEIRIDSNKFASIIARILDDKLAKNISVLNINLHR